MNSAKLVFPEESYLLVGCAHTVFNRLKYGYHEKIYQRAYEEELLKNNVKFRREAKVNIRYNDKIIGRYFLDFIINEKIVVELKVGNDFYLSHIKQIFAYLKSTGKKLGLLILFTPKRIFVKRIVN